MIRVPNWIPQFHVLIELRPVFTLRTTLSYESFDRQTWEILSVLVSVFKWRAQFRVTERRLSRGE